MASGRPEHFSSTVRGICEGGRWLRGRMLDFRSRGPGFESLGHRSVGLAASGLTLALAPEVGNPTHLRPPIQNIKNSKLGQFNEICIYMIGLKIHKTKNEICEVLHCCHQLFQG